MAEEKIKKDAEVKTEEEVKETTPNTEEITSEQKETSTEEKSGKKKKSKKDKKEAKIEELGEKLQELQDKHLRLQAEFDNFRRRTMKEKADLIKSGGESVLVNILPVIDDFERAIESLKDVADDDAGKQGTVLIYNKFEEFLKQNNVKEIEALNEDFDVDHHEALTKIPAPEEKQRKPSRGTAYGHLPGGHGWPDPSGGGTGAGHHGPAPGDEGGTRQLRPGKRRRGDGHSTGRHLRRWRPRQGHWPGPVLCVQILVSHRQSHQSPCLRF